MLQKSSIKRENEMSRFGGIVKEELAHFPLPKPHKNCRPPDFGCYITGPELFQTASSIAFAQGKKKKHQKLFNITRRLRETSRYEREVHFASSRSCIF
jgi:hypothetical protein